MSSSEWLTQAEIDALLNDIEASDAVDASAAVDTFSFGSGERIQRGDMPTLETINERFSRNLRMKLFNRLRRNTEVLVKGIQVMKFGDYSHSLFVPTSLNRIRFKPFRGSALMTLDARLVFGLVEVFFGGDGRFITKIEGREFTATERRILNLFLELVIPTYQDAWSTLVDADIEVLDHEVNPAMSQIVNTTEPVVVTKFHVEIEGLGGELAFCLPQSMLEPVREKLEMGVQAEPVAGQGEQFATKLQNALLDVPLDVAVKLGQFSLPLKQIRDLNVGDVLPIDKPGTAEVCIADFPGYHAEIGEQSGKIAVKLTEPMKTEG